MCLNCCGFRGLQGFGVVQDFFHTVTGFGSSAMAPLPLGSIPNPATIRKCHGVAGPSRVLLRAAAQSPGYHRSSLAYVFSKHYPRLCARREVQ